MNQRELEARISTIERRYDKLMVSYDSPNQLCKDQARVRKSTKSKVRFISRNETRHSCPLVAVAAGGHLLLSTV